MAAARPRPLPGAASDRASAALGWWNGTPDSTDKPTRLPDQVRFALELLRSGATEIEIRTAVSDEFGNDAKPRQAYRRALELLIEEQRALEVHLPEVVRSIRFKVLREAIQFGDRVTAATLLRDICNSAAGALDEDGSTLTVEVLPPALPGAIQGGPGAIQGPFKGQEPPEAIQAAQEAS